MRNLFTLLSALIACFPAQSQLTVKKVIVTEYHAFYIASDNNVYSYLGGHSQAIAFPIGGRKVVDGSGAFNEFRVLDDQGYIWKSRVDLTNLTDRFDTDTTGAAFDKNT